MSQPPRQSQRINLRLPVQVSDQFATHECVLSNFSQGSLYIEYPTAPQKGNGAWRPRAGEHLKVRLTVPNAGGEERFDMETLVAHLTPSGFGATLNQPQLGAWAALMRVRQGDGGAASPRATGRPAGLDVTKLLTEIELSLGMELRKHGPAFLKECQTKLLDHANRSQHLNDQQDLLYALETLRINGADLYERWVIRIEAQFPALNRRHPRPEEGRPIGRDEYGVPDFDLVKKERLDEWVSIAGVAVKIEAKFASVLYELEQRLAVVADRPLTKETNPLGPAVMLDLFYGEIEAHGFTPLPKGVIYRSLGWEVLERLEDVYKGVNEALKKAGILKDIHLRPKSDPPRPKTGESGGGEGGATGGGRPGRGVLGALFNLFKPKKRPTEADDEDESPTPEYTTHEVKSALGRVRGDRSQPLEQRLEQALAADGKAGAEGPARLSDQVRSTVQATSRLVDALQQDAVLTEPMRDAVRGLEAPLVQAALDHPESLNQPDSPLVGIVNDLERLSVALSAEDQNSPEAQRLKSAIEGMLKALEEGDSSPQAIARAKELVEPHVRRYQEMFAANAQRVAEAHRGQSKVHVSKRRVKELIGERLGARAVPKVMVELLRLGWDTLLVLIHLRDGEESDRWRHCIAALDSIAAWFQPGNPFPPAERPALERFLLVLARGLAAVPNQSPLQGRFLGVLRRALVEDEATFRRLCLNQILVSRKDEGRDDEAPAPVGEGDAQSYQEWAQAIAGIAVGDWLVQRVGDKSTRPISLAWAEEGGGQFVFVDGKGGKALHCDRFVLARHLQSGHIFIMEDSGLPLVQRAVQRVLRETYEKLLENSEQDGLTGLPNRRAFTKRLGRTLATIQRDEGTAVVLVVDIDRFKVINDLCGFEGGDQLLINIAHILKTYLDRTSVLARIGDDEYGVLIEYCGREDGFAAAETQRRAIENYIFNWDGRRLPVSASVGMVVVNAMAETAADVLRDADAACYLAKHAGRNKTKVYDTGDADVRRREGEVRAVSLVEDAIRKGRLLLYAQRISPLFADDDEHDEFEVLLRLLDEQDKVVAPDAFLKAAEGYNRLRTLDRWVVEHLFDWLDEHHARLGEIGGFSLNLSAQSISDLTILDLIVERVERCPYAPGRIAFEIDEAAVIADTEGATRLMNRLKLVGCRVFLDRFGSAGASYTYLKDLVVDRVKIDAALIRNVLENDNDFALVKSITDVCHFMKKKVVAEGVEKEPTMVRLRDLEVDFAQGNAVGKPHPLRRLLEK